MTPGAGRPARDSSAVAATPSAASDPFDAASTVIGISSNWVPSSSPAIQHCAGHKSMPWKLVWLCTNKVSGVGSTPYSAASFRAVRPAVTAIVGGACPAAAYDTICDAAAAAGS